MKRTAGILATIVVLGVPCGYGAHLFSNYAWIQDNLKRRLAVQVRPIGDDRTVSEDGVVMAVRREMNVRDRRFRLEWLVAVPRSGEAWACSYEEGFQDFQKGDAVTLIHKPPELDERDSASYIIGLNHEKEGKVARITPDELGSMGQPDGDQ